MTDLELAHEAASAMAEDVATAFANEFEDAEQVAKEWIQSFDTRGSMIPDHDVVHTFSSLEVFVALSEYLSEDLREDHAIHRARVAAKRREEAHARLESALAEFDGVFLDKARGARLAPELLSVIQPDRLALCRRVISTSMRIARSAPTEIEFEEIEKAHMSQFGEYYINLMKLLDTGGDAQRQAVLGIAESRRVALSTTQSRSCAAPLKFLAQCVLLTAPMSNDTAPCPTPGNYL